MPYPYPLSLSPVPPYPHIPVSPITLPASPAFPVLPVPPVTPPVPPLPQVPPESSPAASSRQGALTPPPPLYRSRSTAAQGQHGGARGRPGLAGTAPHPARPRWHPAPAQHPPPPQGSCRAGACGEGGQGGDVRAGPRAPPHRAPQGVALAAHREPALGGGRGPARHRGRVRAALPARDLPGGAADPARAAAPRARAARDRAPGARAAAAAAPVPAGLRRGAAERPLPEPRAPGAALAARAARLQTPLSAPSRCPRAPQVPAGPTWPWALQSLHGPGHHCPINSPVCPTHSEL